ncbi:MAG: Integral rane sensor hybrid histidine kinase [Pedosphaera sp.]|nr:Integral rane sensor hybrid histidine kinase [Pedosphaera sp.]
MSDPVPTDPTDLHEAFRKYESGVRIHNYRVACVLAMIFMPAGFVLDIITLRDRPAADYRHLLELFLGLRLLCSALLFFIWWFVRTPLGLKSLWALGQILPALPSFFISWMIYKTGGAQSTYYAGINLVLLGAALVLRWTLRDSVIVVLTAIGMYLIACTLKGPVPNGGQGVYFNNVYFLCVTGVFVIIGNLVYNGIRYREFQLRFELDQSRALLEESNEKLKELDQVKNRFFANISHELRTPLTLLLSPLETMLHSRDRQFDGATRNLFSIMQANGMRLLKLINDLLDLVRLESGRMEVKREPLEMSAFVKGIAAAAQQMADAKKLKLETAIEPGLGAVLLDRDKLEKTALNLVFNALKFTPAGGTVALRVEKKNDQLVVTVQDTGVGISAKNLPFVFDRFWQADNSSKRKYQGVGIGLSLVKELTEVQGGKVSVESEEGKGTTFTVCLPFLPAETLTVPKTDADRPDQEAPSAATASESGGVQSEEWLGNLYRRAALFPAIAPSEDAEVVAVSKNGSHPTLLVADDEPDMLRFLKSQLNSHYQVIEAVDGLQAVEKVSQFLPDIILLDMNMPEKDGLQVCRELRAQPSTQGIPIILLTARADEETKLAALSAGANDFLSKPFSTSELHVRIKNLVESHHYKEKLSKQNQTLETTIDQLKETETLLVQTEKMASLGRMSAGIIHEINNPLNYATTGLYTLRNKARFLAPEQRADYTEVLTDVEEGIKRVKNIVSGLREFTHPDTEQVHDVEVSEIVASTLKFLSNEWRDKVQIEQQLPARLVIHGNRNKLLQVFVNLFQNSLDATKAKTYTGEKPTIWIEGRVEGDKHIVIVRDNGEGIDAEAINKIFDPFFTTKDVGAGMGLGLSICYRLVQEYDGRISVRSERGKFCEFKLEFPAKNNISVSVNQLSKV